MDNHDLVYCIVVTRCRLVKRVVHTRYRFCIHFVIREQTHSEGHNATSFFKRSLRKMLFPRYVCRRRRCVLFANSNPNKVLKRSVRTRLVTEILAIRLKHRRGLDYGLKRVRKNERPNKSFVEYPKRRQRYDFVGGGDAHGRNSVSRVRTSARTFYAGPSRRKNLAISLRTRCTPFSSGPSDGFFQTDGFPRPSVVADCDDVRVIIIAVVPRPERSLVIFGTVARAFPDRARR